VIGKSGSMFVLGGRDGGTYYSDVWRSADGGATWTRMTASAGWASRYAHASVIDGSGAVLVMGGYSVVTDTYYSDVWRSTDEGVTWKRVAEAAGWAGRYGHTSAVGNDGTIYVMGGYDGGSNLIYNDVWASADGGVTWTQKIASAAWAPRYMHSSVIGKSGSMFVLGGVVRPSGTEEIFLSDVWRSTDGGVTWIRVTEAAGWAGRYGHTSVYGSNGTIYVIGGYDGKMYYSDVWQSTDVGSSKSNEAAGYAYGAPGSNTCPLGSTKIADEATCANAAIAMGNNWSSADATSTWPNGCYWHTTGSSVYLGKASPGAGNTNARLLCATGVTWTRTTEAVGWAARRGHTAVIDESGTIYVVGGMSSNALTRIYYNDVWSSAEGGPVPTVPTFSPPNAYVLGSANSNVCPTGVFRLDTEAACKSAANVAQRPYGGSLTDSNYPVECYWHTVTGSIYWNTHASGAGSYYAQPLCTARAETASTFSNADFVLSALSSNECPPNAVRITKDDECELAATAAHVQFGRYVNLPAYPRGCYWASYGNGTLQQIWLNTNGGSDGNPFARLVCANVKPCDAGTYKMSTAQTSCTDCAVGYYQPSSGFQSSCFRCPNGTFGLRKRASETNDCKLCPAGTYQDNRTLGGACRVCAQCLRNASQMLWPVSLTPLTLIEKQCQTNAPHLVRKVDALVSEETASPSGLSSPAVLGSIAGLVFVAAVILALHSSIPKMLWTNIDVTAQFHSVPQGRSPVKKNTQLGAAFTLAFLFLALALGIALYAANEVVATSALVPPKGDAIRTKLRISLVLPLGDPLGNSHPHCAGISYIQNSFQGMTCNPTSDLSLGKSCEFGPTGCIFTNPAAKLTFSVPWHERAVSWGLAVDSTFGAMDHAVSGVVTSGNASNLISPIQEVVVAVLVQQALLNDTTNLNLTRPGFELRHLPCVPPEVVPAEGWNLTGPALSWNLTIELRVSQNLYETVRFRKQDPLPLAISIFSALVSVMGMWKAVFSHIEAPVTFLRELSTRRRRMRRERQECGLEMKPDEIAFGRVLAVHKNDFSTWTKNERNERTAAIEDLLETRKQHEQRMEQHEHTIRELTQTVLQQQQTLQQLRAIISELQPNGRCPSRAPSSDGLQVMASVGRDSSSRL
jgi:hypothetical protein